MLWEAFVNSLKKLIKDKSPWLSVFDAFEIIKSKTDLQLDHEIAELLISIEINDFCIPYDKSCYFDGHPVRLFRDLDSKTSSEMDHLLRKLASGSIVIDDLNPDCRNYVWYKDGFYLHFECLTEIDLEDTSQNDNDIFSNTEEVKPSEIPLFYLNETLTVIEASCIISGDNPAEILSILNNDKLLESYSKFLNARSLVNSAIKLCTLRQYSDIGIATFEFKNFLRSKNLIINGFNDDIDEKDCISELSTQIQEKAVRISKLESEMEFFENLEQNLSMNKEVLIDSENYEIKTINKNYISELENKILLLEKELENSKIEINKLNTLSDSYTQSNDEVMRKLDNITPEQEIPNSRQRNNILKIISILSDMAGLPPENFKAFNMMDAHATQNNKDIPSKHTVADWLKKARDSN